jgi:nucleotide-binding universal stress UspA family protein
MRMLIATAGVLSPEPVARVAERLAGSNGDVVVITIIQVPRSFLETIRSEQWHPLNESAPEWTTEEDAMIARYVEERGHRITEPLLSALRVRGIEATVRYLEGEDPAERILAAADEIDADLIVVGATKQLFEEWESVSARVLRDTLRPVLVVPNPPRTNDDADGG